MRLNLKIFLIISTILISNIEIFAKCSSSKEFWRAKLKKSQTIEKFFIDTMGVRGSSINLSIAQRRYILIQFYTI